MSVFSRVSNISLIRNYESCVSEYSYCKGISKPASQSLTFPKDSIGKEGS